jgi:DNA recombination protein RmuC
VAAVLASVSAVAVVSAIALVWSRIVLHRSRGEILQLKSEVIAAEARVRLCEARGQDLLQTEERLRVAARAEFENLASRIIERESRTFQESSERGLERVLSPLRERLKDFEKRVEDSYQAEGRERHVLKAEVERLILLNEKIVIEANHLTEALKGENRFQGDWGELVLESILESSGLREGIEYTLQESFMGMDGERYRPDVIIRLPDDKQIIVDSKVSLTSFEAYGRTTEGPERDRHLKALLLSLMNHVDQLSEKHYPKLKGLRTPEFVFLFTPVEPAYLLALRNDPELAMYAWKKGVAIVTSTTLFTSLKTVASIWRLENQNRNAQEIAQEAAKLYDKFVGFYDDFEKIGRVFESGLQQYDEARRKLRDGPGNVFRKIELLRELGAAPAKRLRPELLED